jgi:RNA polymerase sigma-70 factor (ECF subfamily)
MCPPISAGVAVRATIAQIARFVMLAMQAGGPIHPPRARRPTRTTSGCRQGDGDAYRRLIERHQEHVSRILWRFSRDRGVHEELVQDVFVESYLSLNRYRAEAPFEHWLTRIATRVGYRYWKEKARRQRMEPFDVREWEKATDGDGVLQSLEPDQAAELLHRVFEQLSPRDRLVLTLRYLEQCDVVETARRTGWSKTMVKVQTMRARKRLQKLLERSGLEWNQLTGNRRSSSWRREPVTRGPRRLTWRAACWGSSRRTGPYRWGSRNACGCGWPPERRQSRCLRRSRRLCCTRDPRSP